MEGMHRHMPEQIVGAKQSKRACVAFWAIYTMEKEFSSSIGAPSALQDEAITAKPPSQMNSSVDAVNMELHVRLTRLTARILSSKPTCPSLFPTLEWISMLTVLQRFMGWEGSSITH